MFLKSFIFSLILLFCSNVSNAQTWNTNSGNFTSGNLGVGVNYIPTNYNLFVNGKTFTNQLQIGYGAQLGQVLTADANGLATWTTLDKIWNKDNNGNYTLGALGIGISYVPSSYKLHVEGKAFFQQLQIGYSAQSGQVLTADNLGNATWANINAWGFNGNTLTSGSQFIGTTNNSYPLNIKLNNNTRIFLPNISNNINTVSIGANSKNPYYYKFEVVEGRTVLLGPVDNNQQNILQIISNYNTPDVLNGSIHYMSFSHERFSNNEEHGVINVYEYQNPSGPGMSKHLLFQKNSGNVGVGNFVSPPTEKLEVNGNIKVSGDVYFLGNRRLSDILNQSSVWYSNNSSNYYSMLPIAVGRNSVPSGYIAAFDGKVRARGLRCDTDSWADYVFDSNYQLMSLDSLENFIQVNKHLPDVPTTSEVLTNGVDVVEVEQVLLKKIEENTLYLIQLKNENDILKKELEELKKLVLEKSK
jgi:hypothetical protein